MIRLRSFREHDLTRLYELDQLCFAQDVAYSMADLKYFLSHPRCLSWIAEAGAETLAGFLIVERARRNQRMVGHIVTIDVDREMRRQGVGRLLLETAEDQLKVEGASLLTLEVAVNNIAAQAFYCRMGYSEAGCIPEYYAGRLDAQVMEKII